MENQITESRNNQSYSPISILLWSIVFSPALGEYIQAHNLDTFGDKNASGKLRRRAKYLFLFFVIWGLYFFSLKIYALLFVSWLIISWRNHLIKCQSISEKTEVKLAFTAVINSFFSLIKETSISLYHFIRRTGKKLKSFYREEVDKGTLFFAIFVVFIVGGLILSITYDINVELLGKKILGITIVCIWLLWPIISFILSCIGLYYLIKIVTWIVTKTAKKAWHDE